MLAAFLLVLLHASCIKKKTRELGDDVKSAQFNIWINLTENINTQIKYLDGKSIHYLSLLVAFNQITVLK